MTRIIAILLALALALALAAALAACGSDGDGTTTTRGATTDAASAHGSHGGGHPGRGGDARPAHDGGEPMQMAGGMRTLATHEQDGMRIEVIAMEPETFTVEEGVKTVVHRPGPEDDAHLMVTLTDAASGERIPYSSVQIALTHGGGRVLDTRLWPMISRHVGTHYGENVDLPAPGRYDAVLTVGAPQVARHRELADRWTRAQRVTFALEWRDAR